MHDYPFLFSETLFILSVYKSREMCYNIYSKFTEQTNYLINILWRTK
jgi:hypothetical protein